MPRPTDATLSDERYVNSWFAAATAAAAAAVDAVVSAAARQCSDVVVRQ